MIGSMIQKRSFRKAFPYHSPEVANLTGRYHREVVYRKIARLINAPKEAIPWGILCVVKKKLGWGRKALVGSSLLFAYGLICMTSVYEISKTGKNRKSDKVRKSTEKFVGRK